MRLKRPHIAARSLWWLAVLMIMRVASALLTTRGAAALPPVPPTAAVAAEQGAINGTMISLSGAALPPAAPLQRRATRRAAGRRGARVRVSQQQQSSSAAVPVVPPPGRPTPRVVAGNDAPDGRFPYVGLLGVWWPYPDGTGEFEPICSGSFIREDAFLTAAHCVDEDATYGAPLAVLAGTNTNPLDDPGAAAVLGPTRSVTVHSSYLLPRTEADPGDKDIAVVFFKTCITPGHMLQVARIAAPNEAKAAIRSRATFVAAGWGQTADAYEPDVLQYAQGKFLDNKECYKLLQADLGKVFPLSSGEMCVYGLPGADGGPLNQDTCYGDSGGPLVVNVRAQAGDDPAETTAWEDDRLVGLTIWGGSVCGGPKMPGVYTRVTTFSGWISNQLASRPKVCGKTAAAAPATCARERSKHNYFATPTATVRVDRAKAFDQCCSECKARAQDASTGGCVAFSANTYLGSGRRLLQGGDTQLRPAASAAVAAACTTCDADCDIYADSVPARLCKRGEKAPVGSAMYCDTKPLGSGRLVFA